MTELESQNLSEEDLKAQGTQCMLDAIMGNMLELAEEYGYSISEINEQTGQQIGQKFGMELAQKCPASLPILMVMGKDQLEKGPMEAPLGYLSSGETSGSLKSVVGKDGTTKIVVTLKDGSEESFLWIRRFAGSDVFEKDYKQWIGKKVTIKWNEFEQYVLEYKAYGKFREISGIKRQ